MSNEPGFGPHPGGYPAYQPPPAKKNTSVILAIVVVVLLLAGGAFYFVVLKKDTDATAAGGESFSSGEIFLASAESFGDDPYSDVPFATPPVVPDGMGPTSSAPVAPVTSAPKTTMSVPTAPKTTPANGGTPGLYGGTMNISSCDPAQMVKFLASNPAKAAAWVDALNADPKVTLPDGSALTVATISTYVASLTPVVLRTDTMVTNHGFKNGKAYSLQSVLQKGTAVLVDKYGTPRVKCYCGNPLLPPKASDPAKPVVYKGDSWAGFDPSKVSTIESSTTIINVFVITDITTGTLFDRPSGNTGTNPVDVPNSGTATTPAATSGAPSDPAAPSNPAATETVVPNQPAATDPGQPDGQNPNPDTCYFYSPDTFDDVTLAVGQTHTTGDGSWTFRVDPGCVYTTISGTRPEKPQQPEQPDPAPTQAPDPAPAPEPTQAPEPEPTQAPQPEPEPTQPPSGQICEYDDAGNGALIQAAVGSTFTDSRGISYYVNDDCSLTEL